MANSSRLRRKFIELLGGAAAWPTAAWAQQGERMRRIGILMSQAPDNIEGQVRATKRLMAARAIVVNGGFGKG
jgi:hypothetical protein